MIEKKTVWSVNADLKVKEKTAIMEDGRVLAMKGADDDMYDDSMWNIREVFDTEEKARAYVSDQEQEIRDMVPKVRKFINRMAVRSGLLKRLGFKKEDYLGSYASSSDGYYKEYHREEEYAKKLETFVRSRMLNIGGWMLPVGDVRKVQWFFNEDRGDDYEDGDWLAELTMADGETYKTSSRSEVRLVKTVFGENSGTYYIDNDFDYDKDEEEE